MQTAPVSAAGSPAPNNFKEKLINSIIAALMLLIFLVESFPCNYSSELVTGLESIKRLVELIALLLIWF